MILLSLQMYEHVFLIGISRQVEGTFLKKLETAATELKKNFHLLP